MQWSKLAKTLKQARKAPEERAVSYVHWATDNPHRFRLLYDSQLWLPDAAVDNASATPGRASRAWQEMDDAREECQAEFVLPGQPLLHSHLVMSLATGIAIEFVYGDLYGDRAAGAELRKLRELHARELLREALG